jgi:hypothetical protein
MRNEKKVKEKEEKKKRAKRNTGSIALRTHVVTSSSSLRYGKAVSIWPSAGVKAALEVLQGVHLLTSEGSHPT